MADSNEPAKENDGCPSIPNQAMNSRTGFQVDAVISDHNGSSSLTASVDADTLVEMISGSYVDFYCEGCQLSLEGPCCNHGTRITDTFVLPRAIATLPAELSVKPSPDTSVMGVFAELEIPALSIFGPLSAPVSRVTTRKSVFKYALTGPNGLVHSFDLSSDELCNWLKFIRLADIPSVQNVMAYQQDNGIFFTTLRVIAVGEELRVWYSRPYGTLMGKPFLVEPGTEDVTETSVQVLPEVGESVDHFLTVPDPVRPEKSGRSRSSLSVIVYRGSRTAPRTKRTIENVLLETADVDPSSERIQPVDFSSETVSNDHAINGSKRRKGRPRRRSGDTDVDLDEIPPLNEDLVRPHPRVEFMEVLETPTRLRTSKKAPARLVAVDHNLEKMKEKRGRKRLTGVRPPRPKKKYLRKRRIFINPIGPHLGSTTYRCWCPEPDCGMKFRIPELLRIHAQRHVPDPLSEAPDLTCPSCQLALSTLEELLQHVDDRHSQQTGARNVSDYKCTICKIFLKSAENLATHMLVVHTMQKERKVECDVCHVKFVTPVSMKTHRKSHFEKRHLSCPVCLERFANASSMKEHSESHCVNGVYACHLCEKTWATFCTLRRHVRTIHAADRFECDKCDKVFNRKSRLEAHVVVHSEKLEFACYICQRPFRRQDRMREHILSVHKVDKIGGSVRKSALQVRMSNVRKRSRMTNYLEYEFRCEPCKVGFRRRPMLVKHLTELHPDVPTESIPETSEPVISTTFPCEHCDRSYTSTGQLKAHVRKAHREIFSSREDGDSSSNAASASGITPQSVGQLMDAVLGAPRVPCGLCTLTYLNEQRLRSHQWAKHPELFNKS